MTEVRRSEGDTATSRILRRPVPICLIGCGLVSCISGLRLSGIGATPRAIKGSLLVGGFFMASVGGKQLLQRGNQRPSSSHLDRTDGQAHETQDLFRHDYEGEESTDLQQYVDNQLDQRDTLSNNPLYRPLVDSLGHTRSMASLLYLVTSGGTTALQNFSCTQQELQQLVRELESSELARQEWGRRVSGISVSQVTLDQDGVAALATLCKMMHTFETLDLKSVVFTAEAAFDVGFLCKKASAAVSIDRCVFGQRAHPRNLFANFSARSISFFNVTVGHATSIAKSLRSMRVKGDTLHLYLDQIEEEAVRALYERCSQGKRRKREMTKLKVTCGIDGGTITFSRLEALGQWLKDRPQN